jgi:hypothetical protein
MAARQPLELIILVRIQAPQLEFPACKRGFFSLLGLAPFRWLRRLFYFMNASKTTTNNPCSNHFGSGKFLMFYNKRWEMP